MDPVESPLIHSWVVEYALSPHAMDSLEMEAAAHFEADLGPVLPYLNAELSGARYNASIPALIWRYEGHQVGILRDRIVVDHVHEDDDLETFFDSIVELVNSTWQRRAQLDPRPEPRTFRQPLEILALLPQTNCQLCGMQTCHSFALQLTVGEARLDACLPLFDDDTYLGNRTSLIGYLDENDHC